MAEHAVELPADEAVDDGSAGELVGDAIGEPAAAFGFGRDDVDVQPVAEGAFHLQVGEEALVFVFDVAGEPADLQRPDADAELFLGADFEPSRLPDDLQGREGRREEFDDVGPFVKGPQTLRGEGEGRGVFEHVHACTQCKLKRSCCWTSQESRNDLAALPR